MQFKNPEILYALLLLAIPILVHLFQLRRFEKESFTNVQLLKNISLQTRKSAKLKKWLALLTRLLLLACIIMAFAQPYTSATKQHNAKRETVVYLDNSFSMQAMGANGSLLNTAIQDFIQHMDEDGPIHLFTNNQEFQNTTTKAIKNDLIQLPYSPNQLDYEAVVLKGRKAFSKNGTAFKNFILISDFQQKNETLTLKKDSLLTYSLVQLRTQNNANSSIDSLFISKTNVETLELTVLLSYQGKPDETMSVSLFENDHLIAKAAVSLANKAEVIFTIPNNKAFKGKITIVDSGLQYDNTLYFNLDTNERINVLAINAANPIFLKKLYTDDEFDLSIVNSNEVNYNAFNKQHLIVLNELKSINNALASALSTFMAQGGSIAIIPSNDVDIISYNQFLNTINLPGFKIENSQDRLLTKINFSHPLMVSVFEKKVDNFQYPKVQSFYGLTAAGQANILSFEDGAAFLTHRDRVFLFTAALDESNSNFKNSPLIVPVFYNIGKQSLRLPQLYYTIGLKNTIDIATTLKQDDILKLRKLEKSIIPMQQTFSHKVQLITDEFPNTPGIFEVISNTDTLQHLSYNYDRAESRLHYMNLSQVANGTKSDSVAKALEVIKSSSNVHELWKWFVIFAIAFLVVEMLILKFLK